MVTRPKVNSESVLASIMAEESFWPSEPQSIGDTGLPVSVIEGLAIKRLAVVGPVRDVNLAGHLCLPYHMFSDVLQSLRERQIIVHKGSAPFNDYCYALTEGGRDRAGVARKRVLTSARPRSRLPIMCCRPKRKRFVPSRHAVKICIRPSRIFPSTKRCLIPWAPRSTREPDCFSTASPATASPR